MSHGPSVIDERFVCLYRLGSGHRKFSALAVNCGFMDQNVV